MSKVEKSIEVGVPLETAYNQWTQFEEFPRFMGGVEEIKQLDDTRTHWKINIDGVKREFEAEIETQLADKAISWRSVEGAQHAGAVGFQEVDPSTTRVTLTMEVEPEGLVEKAGDALGFVDRQMQKDLEKFKELIESQGTETGAWRGEVHNNQTT